MAGRRTGANTAIWEFQDMAILEMVEHTITSKKPIALLLVYNKDTKETINAPIVHETDKIVKIQIGWNIPNALVKILTQ